MSVDAFRVSAHTQQREMTGSLWSGLQILWCKLTHQAPMQHTWLRWAPLISAYIRFLGAAVSERLPRRRWLFLTIKPVEMQSLHPGADTHQPLPTTTASRNKGNAGVRDHHRTHEPKLTVSKHYEEGMSRLPGGGVRLEFRRTSIVKLAEFLSTLAAVEQPVENRTGLNDL